MIDLKNKFDYFMMVPDFLPIDNDQGKIDSKRIQKTFKETVSNLVITKESPPMWYINQNELVREIFIISIHNNEDEKEILNFGKNLSLIKNLSLDKFFTQNKHYVCHGWREHNSSKTGLVNHTFEDLVLTFDRFLLTLYLKKLSSLKTSFVFLEKLLLLITNSIPNNINDSNRDLFYNYHNMSKELLFRLFGNTINYSQTHAISIQDYLRLLRWLRLYIDHSGTFPDAEAIMYSYIEFPIIEENLILESENA